jgi:DUF4097 and DUF4098 domain-containing protein YvlB
MHQTFETPGSVRLEIRIPAGRIHLDAVQTATTEVDVTHLDPHTDEEPRVRIEARGEGETTVVLIEAVDKGFRRTRQFDVRVRCPEGAAAKVRTGSADLSATGPLSAVNARSGSGDVGLERVGSVRFDSGSGSFEAETVTGPTDVRTASGDVRIDVAEGAVRAHLVSGDLRITRVEGGAFVKTVSGDATFSECGPGQLKLESVSGDVWAGLRPGLDVWLDLRSVSGRVRSGLTPADGPTSGAGGLVELRAHTVSGDITLEGIAGSSQVRQLEATAG